MKLAALATLTIAIALLWLLRRFSDPVGMNDRLRPFEPEPDEWGGW